MTRFHRAFVVYRKELLETLRDRRTLIAMVLVPIVLYPVLMVILVEALRKETGRRQAERYQIVVPDDPHQRWIMSVLHRQDQQRRAQDAEESQSAGGASPAPVGLRAVLRADQVDVVNLGPGASLWRAVDQRQGHLAVIVHPPPNPDRLDDDVNRVVQMIYRDTDPRSEFVYDRFSRILGDEAERIIKARVTRQTGGSTSLTPLLANALSTAAPSRQYTKILAMIVPFLLVTMTVTGAMYPAIDLTAGERERGTLETLAVSPVPVGQIVAGKFLVIITIAMISTTLNLASMSAVVHFAGLERMLTTATLHRGVEEARIEHEIETAVHALPPSTFSQADYLLERRKLEAQAGREVGFLSTAAPIVLLAMVPFAVLAGAVMLAVCSFARTFKEAQNYMMPVMMVAIIPAMVVSYMPTMRLEGVILVIPVVNVVALIRDLFLGDWQGPAMFVCLVSTVFYAAVAVVVAARIYASEAVLFSDVGAYKTLLSRRYMRPRLRPWSALALMTVALLFPAYFYCQSALLDPATGGARFSVMLALSQLLVLALPPLVLCIYAKIDLVETFSLRRPSVPAAAGALLLAVSIVPMAQWTAALLSPVLPAMSADDPLFQFQAGLIEGGSWIGVILAFAVLPGICEELLFRGFLMAGLRDRLSPWLTIVVVGIVFGVFHIYIEKIPLVSLLGMLLTFVCLKSGSIFPAMLIHVANNALTVAAHREETVRNFFGLTDGLVSAVPDARMLAFLAVFVAGLGLIARSSRSG